VGTKGPIVLRSYYKSGERLPTEFCLPDDYKIRVTGCSFPGEGSKVWFTTVGQLKKEFKKAASKASSLCRFLASIVDCLCEYYGSISFEFGGIDWYADGRGFRGIEWKKETDPFANFRTN